MRICDGIVEAAAMETPHLDLDVAGGGDGSASRRERGHQPVAHLLDQHATVVIDDTPRHLLDLAADRACCVVAERSG